MTSVTTNLLVDGYVRRRELGRKQIIPDVITVLIFKYYLEVAKQLWFINIAGKHMRPSGIYISPDIDIEDVQTLYINQQTANYKCKIFDITDETAQLSIAASIDFLDGGICCKTNVIFPKNNFLSPLQPKLRREIDVIFQCNQSCYAKLLCRHHDRKEIVGYKWKLPSLPKQYKGCSVIYSNKRGLIAIGGHEKSHKFMNVHTLSFQTEHIDGNEWKWNNITKTEVSRQHPCCVMIGGGEDRLLAMGGYQYGGMTYSQSTVGRPAMKRTECYDFDSGQWTSLKNAIYPRQKCGMFYDKHKNNIFLVGGQDGYGYSLNKFECYDIAQNVWCRLPSTNAKHGCYPVVWYEENKSILCVASLTGNVIECIDLRQDATKWNVVCAKGNVCMTLGKLFQIKMGTDSFNFQVTDCCRLLKFN